MTTKTQIVITSLLLLSLFFACNTSKQATQTTAPLKTTTQDDSFEGVIIYSMEFEDKVNGIDKEQAKVFIGEENTYFIKKDQYTSEANGMAKMKAYYTGGDTIYTHIQGMNEIYYELVTSVDEEILEVSQEYHAEMIAGFDCHVIKMKTSDGYVEYYYNENISAKPSDYTKHKMSFWSYFIDKTGALPLKWVESNSKNFMSIRAKHVESKPIPDEHFIVPSLKRIKTPEE